MMLRERYAQPDPLQILRQVAQTTFTNIYTYRGLDDTERIRREVQDVMALHQARRALAIIPPHGVPFTRGISPQKLDYILDLHQMKSTDCTAEQFSKIFPTVLLPTDDQAIVFTNTVASNPKVGGIQVFSTTYAVYYSWKFDDAGRPAVDKYQVHVLNLSEYPRGLK